jgi:hypothetical protein
MGGEAFEEAAALVSALRLEPDGHLKKQGSRAVAWWAARPIRPRSCEVHGVLEAPQDRPAGHAGGADENAAGRGLWRAAGGDQHDIGATAAAGAALLGQQDRDDDHAASGGGSRSSSLSAATFTRMAPYPTMTRRGPG